MRPLALSFLAFVTALAAATLSAATPVRAVSNDIEGAACAMPHEHLVRVWRGTDPNRSGQIAFVPQEPNFVG